MTADYEYEYRVRWIEATIDTADDTQFAPLHHTRIADHFGNDLTAAITLYDQKQADPNIREAHLERYPPITGWQPTPTRTINAARKAASTTAA